MNDSNFHLNFSFSTRPIMCFTLDTLKSCSLAIFL